MSRLAAVLVAAPLLVVSTGLASVAFDMYWVESALNRHVVAPVALAALCLVLAAVMAAQAQKPLLTQSRPTRWTSLQLAGAYLLLAVGATVVALWQRSPTVTLAVVILTAVVPCVVDIWALSSGSIRGGLGSTLGVVAAVATFFAVQADPLGTGGVFGALTFLNVASAALVVVGSAALRSARRYRPPHALEWVGTKSAPVLLPVVVWWALAGLTLPASMHDIELDALRAGQRLP